MGNKDKKRLKKEHKTKSRTRSSFRQNTFWTNKNLVYPILVVLGLTFIFFYPSLQNEFVNWDDDVNLLDNPHIKNLDIENIKKIFTSDVIGNYNPLPIFTFAIEHHFVGLDPFLYHLNNLFLHLICVFLVYRLSLLLGVSRNASLLIALLFGIHPMRVESVAWVTERKDVLFSAFYFGALIYYIKFRDDVSKKKYLIFIYLFFILSLFSKIQAVALPLSMLAIDYWRDRKINLQLVWEKLPYFALSLFFGIIGIYMLAQNESLDQSKTDYGIIERLSIGAYSYITYLYKVLFPYPMSPLYPYPAKIPWYYFASLVPALGVVGLMIYSFKRQWKAITFGLVFFTFNIMFLLQIVGAGQGFLADRFTYVAYFGLFFTAAWYADKFLFAIPARKNIGFGAIGALMLVYGIITWNQTRIWQNGETLWTHVLKYTKRAATPYRNRGNYYRDSGQYDKAMPDYQALLELTPTAGEVYNSIGKLYFDQGQFQQALPQYEKATEYSPEKGEFWVNKAATLASLGRYQEALASANKGVEADENHANAYQTRFLILQTLGDFTASIKDIEKLMEFRPREVNLIYEKGRAQIIIGDVQNGINTITDAIQKASQPGATVSNRDLGAFHYDRGRAYFSMGNREQARSDINTAVRLGFQVDQSIINQLNQ